MIEKKLMKAFMPIITALIAAALTITPPVHGAEETPLPPDVTEDIRLPENAIPTSIDETTRLALLQNPDVIIAGLAYDAVVTREMEAESIYDSNLSGRGGWTKDRRPPVVEFLSRESDERDFFVGLSKLLPMGTLLGLEFSSLRTDTDNPFATINPGYELGYKAKLKQPLLKNFLGYIDRGNIALVKLDIRQFDYETLNSIEGSLLLARNAYWDLLEEQEKFKADIDALKNAAEFYRLTKNKLPFGLTEEPDVIAANGNLRRRYITAVISKRRYQNRSDILKAILNIENDDYLRARRVSIEAPVIDVNGELRKAFEKRFDYKSAILESKKKGLVLKMKTVGLLPQLDFEGSFALNALDRRFDTAAGDAWNADGRSFFLGATLDYPLENRKARAERQRAAIEKKKALEEIRKVELQIIEDVLVAARTVETAFEAAEQAAKIEALESEKLDAENKRFLQGRSDSDIIIRFQFDKFEAQKFNIESLAAFFRAKDELLRKTSSLIDTVSYIGEPSSVAALEPKVEGAP